MSAGPSLRLELQQLPPKRPRGLFTEEGRAKVAKLICHGADGNRRYYPHQIEGRIEAVLERIARRLEAE